MLDRALLRQTAAHLEAEADAALERAKTWAANQPGSDAYAYDQAVLWRQMAKRLRQVAAVTSYTGPRRYKTRVRSSKPSLRKG